MNIRGEFRVAIMLPVECHSAKCKECRSENQCLCGCNDALIDSLYKQDDMRFYRYLHLRRCKMRKCSIAEPREGIDVMDKYTKMEKTNIRTVMP